MKLQMINNRGYFVVLPVQITRAKGWVKGGVIEFQIDSRENLVLFNK